MTSPLERYEELIASRSFREDTEQRKAILALDTLQKALCGQEKRRWWQRFQSRQYTKGLYLWGGVGRGKTWMMDLFFETLPFDDKQRIHFHRFMARIHDALGERAQEADPLPSIARSWARKVRVLCLDEFFVSDIADAMLLAGLLEGLFKEGVTVVTTSNIPPSELYKGGLQRARFLPAIALIEKHMQVLAVGGDQDYRLRKLQRSELFSYPLDEEAEALMEKNFQRMTGGGELPRVIRINGRELLARRRSDDLIWFDFKELCERPRSTLDYIEIAHTFHTVLLSGVPVMTAGTPDSARRFINLVDEFYDRNVKLLISAAAPIDQLYTGDRLSFEFERTRSRLTEMQSVDYLAKPHLC